MKTFSRTKAYYCRPLSIFLTLLMAGCSPSKNNKIISTAGMKFSNVVATTANCEQLIRAQMAAKTILLQSIPALATEIAYGNQEIPLTTQISYGLRQQKDENVAISMEHFLVDKNYRESMKYEIALNDENAEAALSLSIDFNHVQNDVTTDLTQSFAINDDCSLTLTQTTFDKITKKNATDYSDSIDNYYIDGGTDNKVTPFKLLANARIANFSLNPDDLADLATYAYNWMPDVGVNVLNVKPAPVQDLKEFGLNLILNSEIIDFNLPNGKPGLSGTLGLQKNPSLQVFSLNGRLSWTIPKDIWDKQALGISRDFDAAVSDKLSQSYLINHNSYKLVSDHKLSYEHASAYWKIQQTVKQASQAANSQTWTYTLTENPDPVIADGMMAAADLASNDTIQTRIPEIQAITRDILKKAPTDKEAQVQLILDYLSEHYSFDDDMVKNNVIRPLTTQEALARGKGVCQHYSVIFTSIARALKIPTRIIYGYHLDDMTAGGHAWVETSMQKGLWRVIEPQFRDGLTNTFTRLYFPLGRATPLEDKNADTTEIISAMTNTYELLPLSQ